MSKITQTQVKRRNVFCNNCLREYQSSVEKPICGKCRSSNVVEASSISDKMALKIIERDLNERLDTLDEVVYDLHTKIKHIERVLDKRFEKQWGHVLSIYKHLGINIE